MYYWSTAIYGGTPIPKKMNSKSHGSPIELHNVGEAAFRVLAADKKGSVLASVTDAVYMLSEEGELCWLISTDSPMHQRAMQVNAPTPRLNAGSSYEVVDHCLITSCGDILDFQHATMWVPPTVSANQILPISRLSETLTIVADRLLACHKPSGLGDLINPILQSRDHQVGAAEIEQKSVLSKKAWPFVNGIILATVENDGSLIIAQGKSLVGFGEGLTPSGDDFLGGFFFSMQLVYHYYPHAVVIPIGIYSNFIHQSQSLTNLISYTILKDHADGHSVEHLHKFANGLLQGESINELYLHVEKLISLGHSTGWDLLSGFLAGMCATFAQKHSM
jgi:hypothetical protein